MAAPIVRQAPSQLQMIPLIRKVTAPGPRPSFYTTGEGGPTESQFNALLGVGPNLISLVPDICIEEQHQDQLVITEQPVEGGIVNDHAYKLPSEVIVTYGWWPAGKANTGQSQTFLTQMYAQILALQWTVPPSGMGPGVATLVNVYTGKRVYTNMVLLSVTTTTDKETENVLLIRMLCKQIIPATVTKMTAQLDASTQAAPEKTQAPSNQGTQVVAPAPLVNVPAIPETVKNAFGVVTLPSIFGGVI